MVTAEKLMDTDTTPLIRLSVRVGMVLALVAVALFGLGSPASAKGPESASITDPWDGRPIDLMCDAYSDSVVRLVRHTGLYRSVGVQPIDEPSGELGPGHTLTWVNAGPPHESVEARTIRQVLYLDAAGGPVIHTPAQESLEGWGPGVIGWFAVSDAVRDALVELGIPLSAAEAATFSDHDCGGATWPQAAATLVLLGGLVWSVRRLQHRGNRRIAYLKE
jgi:hypothetical protein